MPNCKVGDIAVVIRGISPGTLVTVREFYTGTPELMWRVEMMCSAKAYQGKVIAMLPAGSTATIADRYIKPLKDPGDDAVDEMLLIAGKPKAKETNHVPSES